MDELESSKDIDISSLELDENDKCNIIENYPEIATARNMFIHFDYAVYFYSKKKHKYYAVLNFNDGTQYVFEMKRD